ncbi:hypothetical protein PM082_015768 [Marasmius tenuissimus]|nr:hypothetical protein PM082_015768 [Marasmius tenuissimus]
MLSEKRFCDTPKIVLLNATINLTSQAEVGIHTTIQGIGTSGIMNGEGLGVAGKSNVIIRNLVINKVVADVEIFGADAITIQNGSHNVWIDHNGFYSDLDCGQGYYDGPVDITHEHDWITVSYNYFHDHHAVRFVYQFSRVSIKLETVGIQSSLVGG